MTQIKLFFRSPLLYRLMRFFLAGVFIFAGGSKLLDPRSFARTVSGYGLLPDQLLVPVAIALPALEFIAGAGLLFNIRASLNVIMGLLALFLIVIGYAIVYNLDVECGCFSAEQVRARGALKLAFVRDLGLMAICFYLMSFHWRPGCKSIF